MGGSPGKIHYVDTCDEVIDVQIKNQQVDQYSIEFSRTRGVPIETMVLSEGLIT